MCSRCGSDIPAGQSKCSCGGEPARWVFAPETTLILSFVLLLTLFVATGFASRSYHKEESVLAHRWFERGQAAMRDGQSAVAIEAFRTALVYARGIEFTADYDLALARALAQAGHLEESRSYLLGLEQAAPGSGTVNLELARLSARLKNYSDAMRYYNSAIYGVWETDPLEQRRNVRIEFSEFLLDIGQTAEAQAQLVALVAALPPDPTLHVEAGNLFLRASRSALALKEFQTALDENRQAPGAARGAGAAAFQLGDYAAASRYFSRAGRESPLGPLWQQDLDVSNLILSLNPFAPNLSPSEAAHRAAHDYELASDRLATCVRNKYPSQKPQALPANLQRLMDDAREQSSRAKETRLTRHPEDIAPLMETVFRFQDAATSLCGPLSNTDLALQLIARAHAGAQQ